MQKGQSIFHFFYVEKETVCIHQEIKLQILCDVEKSAVMHGLLYMHLEFGNAVLMEHLPHFFTPFSYFLQTPEITLLDI